MAYQIRLRFNRNKIQTLKVASSHEEFEQFTIGKLKGKVLDLIPGVNDEDGQRIIFVNKELKDDETFESCKIKQMSVLVVVLRMRGGEPKGLRRSDSMELLPPKV